MLTSTGGCGNTPEGVSIRPVRITGYVFLFAGMNLPVQRQSMGFMVAPLTASTSRKDVIIVDKNLQSH